MDGGAPFAGGFTLPECLAFLAPERRWVGWRWETRKGRATKPPRRVGDGRDGGYAKNDDPSTWATLDEALAALDAGGLDGIGLQLLDLKGLAAIDLDDVRGAETGALLPWAARLAETPGAYVEITPSREGLRVIGRVRDDRPPIHRRQPHPEGGSFEIYANTETGRYITVTGEALKDAPTELASIDDAIASLRASQSGSDEGDDDDVQGDAEDGADHGQASFQNQVEAALASLSPALKRLLAYGRSGDRSADFQAIVSALRKRFPRDVALEIVRRHPDGPARKFHDRLDAEFQRSWGKAAGRTSTTNDGDETPDTGGEATEDGVALLLVDREGENLRFDHDAGAWFRWQGDHWARDVTRATADHVRALAREVSEGLDARARVAARKSSFAQGAEKLASVDRRVAVRQDDWNPDPMRLGVPGGEVDLATGELTRPDRASLVTRQACVAPAEIANCPAWLEFLHEATGGDDELIGYLKRIFGYALTGDTREHVLVFIYGPGGNGKSVFLNALHGILGDYAVTAPMDAFTASNNDRHATELAMMNGARLVTASETESGRGWAEARIKQLTGGDPISARFMRQDFFTFQPQFKLVIVGNHKPVLRNVDEAARRRFQIVPFTLKPARPDRTLGERLRNEWPGILRWAIEGCIEWQAHGLRPPAAVLQETDAYFGTQDLIGQWLDDCCLVDAGNAARFEPAADLFASWTEWCVANGEKPGALKVFGDQLEQRGYLATRRKVGGKQARGRIGLTLLKEAAPHWGDER
ncbi:phage/plasmid primase, P4 family [Albimonas sp. CAU 1670]|uniref:phage/plasmid primase, P4 family n=1 Tax=Albimonas sp. CAU 1670 TaxID=3032599 RepID=UPI0023DA1CE1|nr:phage/plasmid primase, P4 family [Albimonas sp. CAU 1670]MDF2235767.1 phage/plasmid primase, P4 family [Albimonas sp. CAU 1670]